MRIYLDDDSAAPLLARLLRDAAHDVQIPADVGKMGVNDPVHLAYAIADNRVILRAITKTSSSCTLWSELRKGTIRGFSLFDGTMTQPMISRRVA